jgi:hypothetical protein
MAVTEVIDHPLGGRLLELAPAEEPTDGRERYVGHPVSEELVGTWTEAARHLLCDADAPLPDSAGAKDQRARVVRGGELPLPPATRPMPEVLLLGY